MHRSIIPAAALGLLLLALTVFVHAQNATISIDEIRPGMRGYGLTVFRGTEPERFDVEVIDVMHNFMPDQALILVRTSHPILEQANTVGGMSGSPIYLEGRLAGAYAYGWQFGKAPVAGVTPIANMLADIDRPLDRAIWRAVGVEPLPYPAPLKQNKLRVEAPHRDQDALAYLGQERRHAWSTLREHAARVTTATTHVLTSFGTPQRVNTPLLVGGLDPEVIALLQRELSPFGVEPVQAGGGARDLRRSPTRVPYVNGGAIAVQLIRGDISAQGVGTVTHVRGNRLVAFGHPMLNAGQLALPTANARILHVLASQMRSFKLSEVIGENGSLIHDRQASIVVDTDLEPDTVPLSIKVTGVTGAPRTEWNVELANHRLLTPMLAMSATMNALKTTASDTSDIVFTASCKITLEGRAPIEVTDIGWSGMGLSAAIGRMRVFSVLEAAYANPFERARVLDMNVTLDVRFARDVMTIESAALASDEVDPGKPAYVHVTLRAYEGQPETRIVEVPIPASAAGQALEIAIEAGDDVQPDLPLPRNLDDLLRNVTRGWPATTLLVSTKLPDGALRLQGHVVTGLPASAMDALRLRNATAPSLIHATQRRQEIPIGKVLYGNAKLKLQVRSVARTETP